MVVWKNRKQGPHRGELGNAALEGGLGTGNHVKVSARPYRILVAGPAPCQDGSRPSGLYKCLSEICTYFALYWDLYELAKK
jgi:hypothetical protein